MSKIEWTERSWNPIVGCAIHSPGCTNCYAMRTAHRLGRNPATPQYAGLTRVVNRKPVWTGAMRLHEPALTEPLRRRKPTTWFVNSMSDLFAEGVPDAWLDRIFAVMALTPQHTYQVLTKRADRMRAYLSDQTVARRVGAIMDALGEPDREGWYAPCCDGKVGWLEAALPLPNVWLGVSTEDQRRADERIPDLLATPAAVRWISAEPLLGPIDLTRVAERFDLGKAVALDALAGARLVGKPTLEMGAHREPWSERLDWVVAGGESGPDARPMHPDWARQLRDQCAAAGVPFFFKQWGEWGMDEGPLDGGRDPVMEGQGPCAAFRKGRWAFAANGYAMSLTPTPDGPWLYRLGKKAAGRHLDGVLHDATPAIAGARDL